MSYQDIPNPAALLLREIAATSRVLDRIGGFFARVGDAIAAASTASSRIDKVRALQAKSEAELAEMGLTRDEIVPHVFRDLYYL